MPATRSTPRKYSTNPSTLKARKRMMSLSTVQKVEEDAKLADYKAMLTARKNVQQNPEFSRASESEKATMLEMAMRETMERRRQRGQDTMSKMAAFRAGQYNDTPGPKTRVPITEFLRSNGFRPSDRTGTAGGSSSREVASVDDMDGVDDPFAGGHSSGAGGHPGPVPARRLLRNINLLESRSPFSPTPNSSVKPPPGAFASMSPEPAMLSSIEVGDVPMADAGEPSTARLQVEMRHLRAMCQNLAASNKDIHDVVLGSVDPEMNMEGGRAQGLEARVRQLEGAVRALQSTPLGTIAGRVGDLEGAVEELAAKVGGGCDAEVANMREVMGGLKKLLDKRFA